MDWKGMDPNKKLGIVVAVLLIVIVLIIVVVLGSMTQWHFSFQRLPATGQAWT